MKPFSAKYPHKLSPRRLILGVGIVGIRFYQRMISPILGPHCRFYPTCSEYAVQALTRHGFTKGTYLAMRRLLRCHPFHTGGVDPVP